MEVLHEVKVTKVFCFIILQLKFFGLYQSYISK